MDRPECNEGRVFRRDCPHRLHDVELEQVLAMCAMLREHGVLPEAGGYLDQSAWLMDAFRLVGAAIAESEPTS